MLACIIMKSTLILRSCIFFPGVSKRALSQDIPLICSDSVWYLLYNSHYYRHHHVLSLHITVLYVLCILKKQNMININQP